MPHPLILNSTEAVTVEPTLNPPSYTVVPLHVVSPSVPAPTLDQGRPV